MERALNIKYGLIYEVKRENIIDVSVEKRENINIPKSTQNIKFKYSKVLEKN